MTGGFSTPKKDKGLKVSTGMAVKTGQILLRADARYKAGLNVRGKGAIYAICPGKIYFTRKKTNHGRVRTFLNVMADTQKDAK